MYGFPTESVDFIDFEIAKMGNFEMEPGIRGLASTIV
jgi:hypothetical protein